MTNEQRLKEIEARMLEQKEVVGPWIEMMLSDDFEWLINRVKDLQSIAEKNNILCIEADRKWKYYMDRCHLLIEALEKAHPYLEIMNELYEELGLIKSGI